MRTYTPDEYRKMAERKQFGRYVINGVFRFGWLIDYKAHSKRRDLFYVTPGNDFDTFLSGWDCSTIFTPCAEPVELEFKETEA